MTYYYPSVLLLHRLDFIAIQHEHACHLKPAHAHRGGGSNELHLLRYIYLSKFFGVTNTFRVYFKMGTFTLLKYIF